jgi:outer membrane protein assembly factor BamA
VLDRRSPDGISTRGASIGIAVWRFEPLDDTPGGGFNRLIVDARQLYELAGPRHVLALAEGASLTSSAGSEPPPFFLQSTLGGSKTVRGLGSYRLRGPIVVHAAAEYRFRAHRRIELAAFLDAGSATPSVGTISRDSVIVTPGAGIRILTSTSRIARFDWGRGPDGHRFVLTVGGPF